MLDGMILTSSYIMASSIGASKVNRCIFDAMPKSTLAHFQQWNHRFQTLRNPDVSPLQSELKNHSEISCNRVPGLTI